jgi:diaminohydroxyphosphoribosylaminopyrimidine deaminase/5-amino-6-(5-phosphoribosylamino)uracil reductase
MTLALQQARVMQGNTDDNPSVGCVVVKHNNVISAGFTGKNGRPHAEQNALKSSRYNLEGSIMYVTLEPCSNYGKTPPCVNLIKKKKIKKVFYSINDPDVKSFNKCKKNLNQKGINVTKNILKKEIKYFYRSYEKKKLGVLPFVTCKLAITKDFYTINKANKWITNIFSRGRVHLMRSTHDCLITTSRTVNCDNSQLTCRINGLIDRSPSRIILDRFLRVKISSNIIKDGKKFKTIIFYNHNNKRKIQLLKKFNVKCYKIDLNKYNNLDLNKSLIKAKKLGFSRILVESGLKLISELFKEKLIDEFKLFISKNSINKNGKGNAKKFLEQSLRNKIFKVEKVNLFGEKLLSYKLK